MNKAVKFLYCMVLTAGIAQAQGNPVNPQVTLHTSKGDIRIELFQDKAPLTVENFLQYARDGFYDGTVFHRVISHFMIQGGGFTIDPPSTGLRKKATREPIRNEATNGLSNQRGTLAMARTSDPHSATAQFFINVELNTNLDHRAPTDPDSWGYAVFGKVTSGMEVVDDIRLVPTGAGNRPLETITINSVEIH